MINNGKAIVKDSNEHFRIIIPSKKNWFMLVFCIGWFFANMAVSELSMNELHTTDRFIFIMQNLIRLLYIAILAVVIWGFLGKEKFEIQRSQVLFEKTVFGIGIKKVFNTSHLKNFRPEFGNDNVTGPNKWSIYGLGPGKIKFDYGFKTYTFGLALDDAEANYLIELLQDKLDPLSL